jgi:hypothetical protein
MAEASQTSSSTCNSQCLAQYSVPVLWRLHAALRLTRKPQQSCGHRQTVHTPQPVGSGSSNGSLPVLHSYRTQQLPVWGLFTERVGKRGTLALSVPENVLFTEVSTRGIHRSQMQAAAHPRGPSSPPALLNYKTDEGGAEHTHLFAWQCLKEAAVDAMGPYSRAGCSDPTLSVNSNAVRPTASTWSNRHHLLACTRPCNGMSSASSGLWQKLSVEAQAAPTRTYIISYDACFN